MEFSILGFRVTKQFFGRTAFFCGLLWSLWVFSAIFLRCRTQIPLPTSLFCRQRLGDEKKILRRSTLPENGNGNQVSLLAAPAFIEQSFGWYLLDLDLYIGLQGLQFPTLPAAAQDAVMADPYKSFRQNMKTEAPDKLLVAQGHFLFFAAFAVILVLKTDLLIRHFFYAVIADGDFVSVSPQVLDHLFRAAKRPLGIHYPVFGEKFVH